MKKSLLLFLLLGNLELATAQSSYNFSNIDNLIQTNLQTAFRGKVCVAVKRGDTLIYYKSLGGYDSTSTALIASATKDISAAVILSQAGDGLLNIGDSVGKYLPVFTRFGKGRTTIRQNFSHTGGWDSDGDFHERGDITLAQAADSIAEKVAWRYQPGTRFSYGGISMHVIGRVAEVAENKSWDSIFTQRIKRPLGMSQTVYQLMPTNPRIAGGIASSPSDLMKFTEMLLNNGRFRGKEVLKPAFWEEMWRDQTNKAPILNSPYPARPAYNNPYNTDTIRYGFGAWLDIYNPTTRFQEQISGAGAFGTIYWVNRCNGTTGVIFTTSTYTVVTNTGFQIIDAVNNAVNARGKNCNTITSIVPNLIPDNAVVVRPNPAIAVLNIDYTPNLTPQSLTVFDPTGRPVLVQKYHFNSLKINELARGFYILKIQAAEGLVIKKFVKE